MALRIVPYEAEHTAAVAACNARLRAAGSEVLLPAAPLADWLPHTPDDPPVWMDFFLAMDGAEVRGGYRLRRERFVVAGELRQVGNYQGPISEGIFDKRYMMAGVLMLRHALKQEPLLYALGMGARTQPLPTMLAASGWPIAEVPFRFRVVRGGRFLRHIRPLRRTRARALACDLGAAVGAGALGFAAWHAWRGRHAAGLAGARAEVVDEFGPWTDALWAAGAGDRPVLGAVRTAASLARVFPAASRHTLRLRVDRGGEAVGFAALRCTPMHGHKYFGDMTVGSLVDCGARPGEEDAVVAASVAALRRAGADLVVTNQAHGRWLAALDRAGFLAGPSNFLLALCPALAEVAGDPGTAMPRFHFNRADGDGPINL